MSRERALRKQGLAREKEALERQTAISDILRVISSSQADVRPVLETIAAHAARICHAQTVDIVLADGLSLRIVASVGDEGDVLGQELPVDRSSVSGRAIVDRAPVHVADMQEAGDEFALGRELARKYGFRTILGVPLLREGRALGAIMVRRAEVRPVEDKYVALLKTFAGQAAIAIENARLFNETREALERQTATAEILRVISSTPTDVQPVFESIVQKCHALYSDSRVALRLIDGDRLVTRASTEAGAFEPTPIDRESGMGACVVEARTIHLPDLKAAAEQYPRVAQLGLKHGYRSGMFAPLLREGRALGGISVLHRRPGAFNEKDAALLTTFADQAVIAIENTRLFNETKEALERQTATAEILGAMSSSLTDTQPVFDIIAERAVALCGAEVSVVSRLDGTSTQLAAIHGISREGVEALRKIYPVPLDAETATTRAFRTRSIVHLADVQADSGYEQKGTAVAAGWRSALAVPMLRGADVIGVIFVGRSTPGLFAESQVELLKTFADQAVIAIENVRLFNETKEALEQQTATSSVLSVISSSPTDVEPVFNAIVAKATQLCEGHIGWLNLYDGERFRTVAYSGDSTEYKKFLFERGSFTPQAFLLEIVNTRSLIHIPDIRDTPSYREGKRHAVLLADLAGARSYITVPLLKEGRLVGTLSVYRPQVRPFTDKQIALVKTFADQAVIAIENARLFNETKEALERQTATSDILRVISSSTTDVQPVFDEIVQSGLKLFPGATVVVALPDEERVRIAAVATANDADETAIRSVFPIALRREYMHAVAIMDRRVIDVSDAATHTDPSLPGVRSFLATGLRAATIMPMLRGDAAIGTISVIRRAPGPLTDKQVALLRTFADQAVIAIENVRLFKELQERTEALTKSVDQLTALGEVGQAISSTLDLETVLKTIVSRAVQLTGLDAGAIYEYDEPTELFHLRAAENISEELLQIYRAKPIKKGDGAVGGTAIAREPVQIPETQDESYKSQFRDLIIRTGRRALLAVPLIHEEQIVGALTVQSNRPGPFRPEIIELLKTFATQSALAIQNAKLFREIQEKSAQLEVANKHKSDFLANMSHELRTPLNAIIGFSEALMDQMFGDLNEKQLEYQKDIHESGKHLLSLINDILDLSKIEAGRMELELSSFHLPTAVSNAVTLVRERAMRHGIALGVDVDERLGDFQADERKVKQVLLNLLSNAVKFTPDGGRVDVSAKLDTDKVEIAVKDTGVGIAPEDQASLFEEFKQLGKDSSRKAEGTGLGLALTKRLVELHGGQILVDSAAGKGSTFKVMLPLRQ